MALLLVLIYILIAELSKAVDDGRVKEQDGVTLRILTYLTCFSLAFFPLVWLVGQVLPVPLSLSLSLSLSLYLSLSHTHIRSLPRSHTLSLSPSKPFALLTRGWSEQEGAASASLTTEVVLSSVADVLIKVTSPTPLSIEMILVDRPCAMGI